MLKDWKDIEGIVIYGLGQVAERYIDKIVCEFNVLYIIDKQKCGTNYKGIPVKSYEEVKDKIDNPKIKIVVMTSQRVYAEIKQILENEGKTEEKDFCRIEQFVVQWYRYNKNQINIIQMNTAVTTWCTLNCEKCNMFMSHYDNAKRQHYSFEEMKKDVDLLMKFVDYLFLYSFLGGEPFLNKELKKIIAYVGNEYNDKIGKIGLTTNGTIIPDNETLETLKKYNVLVSISDYTAEIDYSNKLAQFIQVLEENEIAYRLNEMKEWKDFGFPEDPFHWGVDGVVEHMKSCSPLFHGINDRKVYYCHIIWSAEKAGLYTVPSTDFLSLEELDENSINDRIKVSDYCMGKCDKGFLGLCMLCGGCGEDNQKIIKAAIQKNGG